MPQDSFQDNDCLDNGMEVSKLVGNLVKNVVVLLTSLNNVSTLHMRLKPYSEN